MADLDVRVEDGALWLTLNRPEVFNALTGEMADDIARLLEEATARDDVRVVVVTGTGAAFSTGADISGANAHENFDVTRARPGQPDHPRDRQPGQARRGRRQRRGRRGRLLRRAGGRHHRGHESASFLLAFARIGLMPDGGATATVAASIGRARAMRMGLLAEPLTAREAYDAGLVTHVTSDAEFDDRGRKIVRRLAAGPPLAFAATKKAINAATLHQLDGALERERTARRAAAHRRRRRGHARVRGEAEARVPRRVAGRASRPLLRDGADHGEVAVGRDAEVFSTAALVSPASW